MQNTDYQVALAVPVYNEEETVELFVTTIEEKLASLKGHLSIVFIDDGRVVDVGTHNELVLRCPDYKKMVDLQKLEDEGRQHNA